MFFVSTQNSIESASLEHCLLQCFTPSDALYIPSFFPKINHDVISRFENMEYTQVLSYVLSLFIENEMPRGHLQSICNGAYNDFPKEVFEINDINRNLKILNLAMGPTLCVKDHGANLAASFLEYYLKNRGERKTVIDISGGYSSCSAMAALKDKQNIDLFTLINKGAFDKASASICVKHISPRTIPILFDGDQLFINELYDVLIANRSFRESVNMCFIDQRNVMNIFAYMVLFLVVASRMHMKNFCLSIPTGNMGIAIGAYFAKQMGAPIAKIILAGESNDFLHNFYKNGEIKNEKVKEQRSRAINFSVPINFERLLYFLYNAKQASVNRAMQELSVNDRYKISKSILRDFQNEFFTSLCNDKMAINSAVNSCKNSGFLVESHTAIAFDAAENFISEPVNEASYPMLVCQTASYARDTKFVSDAIGYQVENSKIELPWEQNDWKRFNPLEMRADATTLGRYILSKVKRN